MGRRRQEDLEFTQSGLHSKTLCQTKQNKTKQTPPKNQGLEVWDGSSVVECLLSMHKAQGSIPAVKKKKKR
jgi:hypothetical protein